MSSTTGLILANRAQRSCPRLPGNPLPHTSHGVLSLALGAMRVRNVDAASAGNRSWSSIARTMPASDVTCVVTVAGASTGSHSWSSIGRATSRRSPELCIRWPCFGGLTFREAWLQPPTPAVHPNWAISAWEMAGSRGHQRNVGFQRVPSSPCVARPERPLGREWPPSLPWSEV